MEELTITLSPSEYTFYSEAQEKYKEFLGKWVSIEELMKIESLLTHLRIKKELKNRCCQDE